MTENIRCVCGALFQFRTDYDNHFAEVHWPHRIEHPTSNLLSRLRAQLIVVPKPGSEPFVPSQPFWVTTSVGGEHQPGESAGLQYLPNVLAGPQRVQEHVYAIEPLPGEAADEIERLTIEREDAEKLAESLQNKWANRPLSDADLLADNERLRAIAQTAINSLPCPSHEQLARVLDARLHGRDTSEALRATPETAAVQQENQK